MASIKVIVRAPTGTEVYLDGKKVKNLVDVSVQHRVGDVPRVCLEIIAKGGVEVEGDADVVRQLVCAECGRVEVDQSPEAQLAYMRAYSQQHNRKVQDRDIKTQLTRGYRD